MTMRFVFRVDASTEIGTGHVFRCLTLANELSRQGHECLFVCRENHGHLGHVIVNQGHDLKNLPTPTESLNQKEGLVIDGYATWLGVPWQEDADQTLDVIAPLKIDWLVVDHYALHADWERKLSNAVSKIMVIDDLANRAHECALLLDQNFGREAIDYDGLLSSNCCRLIGSDYALLRPEFKNLRDFSLERRNTDSVRRVLISFGGVDHDNVTGQIVEIIARLPFMNDLELDIVMGVNAPFSEDLRHQVSQLKIKATVSVNVVDMAKRMTVADISIGAGGGTSWERACLGLPSVVVAFAENQLEGVRALKEVGAIELIVASEGIAEKLPTMLERLINSNCIEQMSKAARAITDGNGVYRVLQHINSISR